MLRTSKRKPKTSSSGRQDATDKAADEKTDEAKLETERAIKHAHAEVEQLSAEMAKIQAALVQAKERLGSLEKARGGRDARSVYLEDIKAAKKLWAAETENKLDDRKAAKNREYVRWSVISKADAS